MFSLTNPWVLLGALCLLIASFFGGYTKGSSDTYKYQQIEIAKQKDIAHAKEQELQTKEDENTRRHQNEVRSIQSRLNDAIKRLRNRPERLPEESRANCSGASGAELSREDAEFLEREAARADSIREALNTCYLHVDGQK